MIGAAIQTIFTRNMYIHVLMVISLLKLGECHNNLFGTAELRGTLPRRSRLLSDFASSFSDDHSRSGFVPAAIPLSSSKSSYSRSLLPTEESTTATVTSVSPPVVSTSPEPNSNEPTPTADTMRKYARILKIDTENMNEEQRELLLRIVQRIARLNGARPDEESIDLNVNEGRARRNKHRDDRKKKKPSTTNAAASDAPNSTTKAAASTSTTASTSSSSSKKHRTTPSSHSSSSSTGTTTTTTASKKKVAASNYIAISTATASPTTPTIATKVGKSKVTPSTDLTMSNATSMDLGNISTTSIVDVLSTDNARENFYIRRPSPSTITALHNKIQPQKVSETKKIQLAFSNKTPV